MKILIGIVVLVFLSWVGSVIYNLNFFSKDLLLLTSINRQYPVQSFIVRKYIRYFSPIDKDHVTDDQMTVLGYLSSACGFTGAKELTSACKEMLNYFIESGAALDKPSTNKLGLTPLQEAIASGNMTLVKYLIDKGANPNSKSGKSKIYELTPLEFINTRPEMIWEKSDIEKIKSYLRDAGAV